MGHRQHPNLKMDIDGLVQERSNPMANALEYVFLALNHRYDSSHKSMGCSYSPNLNDTFEELVMDFKNGWVIKNYHCYYVSLAKSQIWNWWLYCKSAVTPLLMHWSYCSLALSQRNKLCQLKKLLQKRGIFNMNVSLSWDSSTHMHWTGSSLVWIIIQWKFRFALLFNTMISAKFCSWHNSCTVVVWAKFCNNWMDRNCQWYNRQWRTCLDNEGLVYLALNHDLSWR